MIDSRIKKKKVEMHKRNERAVTDYLWSEIETLQWILAESEYQKTTKGPGRAAATLLGGYGKKRKIDPII